MIKCEYTGTAAYLGHPYLIGSDGECPEYSEELLKKYLLIKIKHTRHNEGCGCQKCCELSELGNTLVIYTVNGEDYRVFLKNLEIVYV